VWNWFKGDNENAGEYIRVDNFTTADLYDEFGEQLQVAEPVFRDYGWHLRFGGPIATVKVFEDNSLVRGMLETPGHGRVLVVDGGGSLRCALVGDNVAALARDNGWAGVIVYGCIRDSAAIGKMSVGLKALNTNPRKSVKRGEGEHNIPVTFAGVTFTPGHFVYVDEDGIVVAEHPLVQTEASEA
jgi:regulator of ribonuclease activity A